MGRVPLRGRISPMAHSATRRLPAAATAAERTCAWTTAVVRATPIPNARTGRRNRRATDTRTTRGARAVASSIPAQCSPRRPSRFSPSRRQRHDHHYATRASGAVSIRFHHGGCRRGVWRSAPGALPSHPRAGVRPAARAPAWAGCCLRAVHLRRQPMPECSSDSQCAPDFCLDGACGIHPPLGATDTVATPPPF